MGKIFTGYISDIQVSAMMVMWDWLQAMAAQWVLERVVWKSASMRPGEQCQMMDGQSQRLAWYADNLAILDSVSLLYCKM